MGDATERLEAVASGVNKLVGADVGTIVGDTARLLDDPVAYHALSVRKNPFGDGTGAEQIVSILKSMSVFDQDAPIWTRLAAMF
ncbi:UDP-N-acetylglucosamine 2-epimerase [Paraburkholderia xenovorans]|uniref:UDP-N-acetylglucosamine 2-epimerase n=1 Tax=Paraburkholderia xenovorans TaxID=36873 RepID=UPI0038B7AA1C